MRNKLEEVIFVSKNFFLTKSALKKVVPQVLSVLSLTSIGYFKKFDII